MSHVVDSKEETASVGPSEITEHGPALWRMEKIYLLNWTIFGRCLDALREQIAASMFRPTVVVAIARGGIVPAMQLANAFSCTDFRIIAITRNTGNGVYSHKKRPECLWMSSNAGFEGSSVLLVDDIVGAGATLALALDVLASKGAVDTRTAAVVKNCNCAIPPHYFSATVDDWVIFPWEVVNSETALPIVPLEGDRRRT